MDLLILASISILVLLFGVLFYFLRFSKSKDEVGNAQDPGGGVQDLRARPPIVRRGVRGGRPPAAAGNVRHRRVAAQDSDDDDEGDAGEEETFTDEPRFDKNIGTKKAKKLEEKAARKAQLEAEREEREERKKQEEILAKQRKKEEKKKEAEEAAKAAEEQKLKEEREKQEHEEYLRLKQEFSVEDEGTDALDEQDAQSLLQEFISYIKKTKIVMLEDLATHFKIKTQDAIDRIKTLQEDGTLSGVIDDRGKFVYITSEEYEAVAKFIKQRGRVSITELADSMNVLINLNPDNLVLQDTAVLGSGTSGGLPQLSV